MADSTWRQLEWADARDGWGTPGTTADGARDTYLITTIDGHIVLARWTRHDPPAPHWQTIREALTTALIIPSTPMTETHAALLAEAYENGTSLTSRAWHHPGTQALPIRDAINAAHGDQHPPPSPAGNTALAALARLAAQGRHDSVRIIPDEMWLRQFATPGDLDHYLHAAAGPRDILPGDMLPGDDPRPGQP